MCVLLLWALPPPARALSSGRQLSELLRIAEVAVSLPRSELQSVTFLRYSCRSSEIGRFSVFGGRVWKSLIVFYDSYSLQSWRKWSTAAAAATVTTSSSTSPTEAPPLGSSKQGSQSKALNRTDSDDERRQYWKDQLPDDIIPDFSVDLGENDDRLAWQHHYSEESSPTASDVSQLHTGDGSDSLDILVMHFPGFAAQSLADILAANNGDLFITFEMLTQLELQDDSVPGRHLQSQPQLQPATQNINLGEFPALADGVLSSAEGDMNAQQGLRSQRGIGVEDLFTSRPYGSGGGFRGAAVTDFAAAVRKNAAINPSAQWERLRSDRLSHTGDYPVKGGEKLGGSVPSRVRQSAPVWLETGEAVANMYADLREEARDHARVRNTYFEQARQAYLSGNKALARELAAKGQVHNGLMKDAHNKAGETIFQQRNMSTRSLQNGQSQLLDLHGLHVSEAIPLLKRELAGLRAMARSSHQRVQVLICVGTGHHTKGSRTPARLPVAVEKFLAEDERLPFTEQQPGMLMVVLS
ncbi:hypothetical protein GOP47_0005171 [Adiantum capillus-veneris]|uniref:Smr domain-containing protein n=1 Tax=Adiantum capillus-veneris TaxID=13818 RepID=A0A9D4V692_ADICA|nr:hypothetical protein GOP47_0005171 [Adiantum capillus-veneris]